MLCVLLSANVGRCEQIVFAHVCIDWGDTMVHGCGHNTFTSHNSLKEHVEWRDDGLLRLKTKHDVQPCCVLHDFLKGFKPTPNQGLQLVMR
jgi:hypothetical protein